MRVLLLSTTRGARADWLGDVVAPLAHLRPQLQIVLLTKPAEKLAVEQTFVVRSRLRPGRAVRQIPGGPGRGQQRPRRERVTSWIDRAVGRLAPSRWTEDRNLLFASGVVWSKPIRREFSRADLVIALDWNTTWAAWLLARRIEGPSVVFGVEGALLKLAELDAGEPQRSR